MRYLKWTYLSLHINCRNPSLGRVTKAKVLVRVRANTKLGSHILMPSGVQKNVREKTLTLPSELPCWELESLWILECSESDYKGQNPIVWEVFYTIRKLLKHRCLKWLASPIWTSETQVMAKRRAGNQIGSLNPDH